ncbi:unnamed protein product [Urochloa decumbens]|uniref:BTB domain-containing protein n=1 Tax=Urochloa decumbens TaxID=240449 RepID=A0ABC8XY74_9POAL
MPPMTTASGSPSSSIAASMATGHHLLRIFGYSHAKELAPHGKWIDSRPFTTAAHSWHIMYYPNGMVTRSADHIAVFLVLDDADADAEPVTARVVFTLLDQAGKPVPWTTRATPVCKFSVYGQGLDDFLRTASATHLRRPRHYQVRCLRLQPNNLSRHLGGLLASGDAADVAFRVAGGGETFQAHRCVLAARSPVFRAELLGPTKEGGDDPAAVIEVGDMEADEVFRVLLEFVHTDALPEMRPEEEEASMCRKLLAAADRYDMERLKLMCEGRLRKHMDGASVATILVLAERHRCPSLKETCFRFLEAPRVLTAVSAAGGIELLAGSSPTLLTELIFRLFAGC